MMTSRKNQSILLVFAMILPLFWSACGSNRATTPLPQPGVTASPDQEETVVPEQTDELRRPGLLRRSLGVLPFVSSGDEAPRIAAAPAQEETASVPEQTDELRRPGLLRRSLGILPFVSSGDEAPRIAAAPAQEETAAVPEQSVEPRRPGLLRRSLGILPFVSSGDEVPATPRRVQSSPTSRPADALVKPRQSDLRGLELSLSVTPQTVDLSETKRLQVHIILRNEGKRTRSLKFTSAQQIDVLIRDEYGNVISRWSEDYVFTQMLTTLTINPQERIEWNETITTREMEPGRLYTLDVAVVGYSGLQVSKPLRPVQ